MLILSGVLDNVLNSVFQSLRIRFLADIPGIHKCRDDVVFASLELEDILGYPTSYTICRAFWWIGNGSLPAGAGIVAT